MLKQEELKHVKQYCSVGGFWTFAFGVRNLEAALTTFATVKMGDDPKAYFLAYYQLFGVLTLAFTAINHIWLLMNLFETAKFPWKQSRLGMMYAHIWHPASYAFILIDIWVWPQLVSNMYGEGTHNMIVCIFLVFVYNIWIPFGHVWSVLFLDYYMAFFQYFQLANPPNRNR